MRSALVIRIMLILTLLAGSVTTLVGQKTTQLTGRITDPADSVIPGATVTVINDDTGIKRETTTNDLGYYTVPLLPPAATESTFKCRAFGRSAGPESPWKWIRLPGLTFSWR